MYPMETEPYRTALQMDFDSYIVAKKDIDYTLDKFGVKFTPFEVNLLTFTNIYSENVVFLKVWNECWQIFFK